MKKITVFLIFMIILGCSSTSSKNNKDKVRGMFVYFADAALIFQCETGERIFIRGGDGYLELEREYLEARSEPGDKIYVELSGRYEMAPKMDGEGREKVFRVFNVIELDNKKECF